MSFAKAAQSNMQNNQKARAKEGACLSLYKRGESSLRILAIGDVVGTAGCEMLRRRLATLKRQYHIDLTIVNGENSAEGNGILPSSAEHLFTSGADVITGGNHTFRRREIIHCLEQTPALLRPANYPDTAPGQGMYIVDKGAVRIAVINLLGVVYLEPLGCPFETADRLVAQAQAENIKIILVDLHAEATAEKKALAYYLDGRVSAVFGTHTHVLTADEQILPHGTGYITDLGMTGPFESVLGVKPPLSIAKMKDKLPVRFENAPPPCILTGCIFEIDPKTGKTLTLERVDWRDPTSAE